MRSERSIDYKDCQEKCEKDNLCQKWSYVTTNLSWKCELKISDGLIPRHRCAGCLSGFQNTDMKKCGVDGKIYIMEVFNLCTICMFVFITL